MEKPIWEPAIDPIKDSDPVAELLAHRLILDAVKTGDTARARTQLLNHFDHVKARIEQYAQSDGVKSQDAA